MKQYLLFLRDDIIRNSGKLPFSIVLNFICIWLSSLFMINKANVTYLKRKHTYILKFLFDRYDKYVPQSFSKEPYEKNYSIEELPIWVLWFQGENKMPDIVKLCYRNIQKYCNGRKVILLTKDNIAKYLQISKDIYEKVEKGHMGYANFSDLIRVSLLYKYGGTWIDATVFVKSPIDNSSLNKIFDSIKIHPLTEEHISGYRWTSFYLFSYPKSEAMKCFRDVMFAYWKDGYNKIIDYFLIDYTFVMLYIKNTDFRKIIDSRPFTNEHVHDIQTLLDEKYNGQFEKWNDTNIFKLNKKFKHNDTTVLTVYKYMIEYL